jgi:hypothetical protein
MKKPMSLAMPAEATFTAVLVCAKDGKSASPANATHRQTGPASATKRELN